MPLAVILEVADGVTNLLVAKGDGLIFLTLGLLHGEQHQPRHADEDLKQADAAGTTGFHDAKLRDEAGFVKSVRKAPARVDEGMYSNHDELILASASPRRQQFLRDLGLHFRVVTASVVEEPLVGEEPGRFARRMALDKARAVRILHPTSWIVSGDTVVSLGPRIFGKPRDREEAVVMLLALAGRVHVVETAFCLCHGRSAVEIVASAVTRVRFAPFDEATAQAYAATGECLDKAGAYGIQGTGSALVQAIEGSYSNVVGLPLCELLQVLSEQGVVKLADLSGKGNEAG